MSQDFRHLFYWLKTLFAYLQYCIGPGPLVNKPRQFCEFSDFAKIIAIMSVVNVVVVLIFKQNVRIIMPVIYNTAQQYTVGLSVYSLTKRTHNFLTQQFNKFCHFRNILTA